jgi:hypothetical protein
VSLARDGFGAMRESVDSCRSQVRSMTSPLSANSYQEPHRDQGISLRSASPSSGGSYGNTGVAPAAVGWNGHAYIAFTGTDSQHHINFLEVF